MLIISTLIIPDELMTAATDPEGNFGILVTDVARLLRRNFDRRLRSLGLTQAQWRAVAHLSRADGMTQAALAESLEIQPVTAGRLIDRMAGAGWVERRSHPLDRRAVQLHLTPKAGPILDEIRARAQETIAESLAGLTAGARRELIESLKTVKRNLVAADAAAPTSTARTNDHAGRKSSRIRRAR